MDTKAKRTKVRVVRKRMIAAVLVVILVVLVAVQQTYEMCNRIVRHADMMEFE